MITHTRKPTVLRARGRRFRPMAWGWGAFLAASAACSEDEVLAPQCAPGSGPVAGPADSHCEEASGTPIVQAVGMCVQPGEASAAPADQQEEHAEEEHEEEHEELGVFYGREAYDDDCKYRVSFENDCVALNEPVTFTVHLRNHETGLPAAGASPSNPEIFLESDPTHISPSNDISAPEGPPGTYAIGPIVFDRSGRWVVRFHFFETCSDLVEDSPHGHTAFYIDVP